MHMAAHWLTLLSCVFGESSQTWSRCQVWSAPSATFRNTCESSAAALSLQTTQMISLRCSESPLLLFYKMPGCIHRWAGHPGRACWRCQPQCSAANWGRPREPSCPGCPGGTAWRTRKPPRSAADWDLSGLKHGPFCLWFTVVWTICTLQRRFETLRWYLWQNRCVSFSTGLRCCWRWCLFHSCRGSWVLVCSQNGRCTFHSSEHD